MAAARETDAAYKIIADHIRTVAFAIGDHAIPSNEGRGYILRRLIRRAVRYAKTIGIESAFMYKLVPTVADIMADYYPEVKEQETHIMNIIQVEEERFHETLHEGLDRLTEIMDHLKEKNIKIIPGKDVFKLYDTYGFPKELTEEYVLEYGFKIDEEGFVSEMEAQRNRARSARDDADSMHVQSELLTSLTEDSTFIGYKHQAIETNIVYIIGNEALLNNTKDRKEVSIILKETPFYAESGGQIADNGWLYTDNAKAKILDVQKAPNGQHIHTVRMDAGTFEKGEKVHAVIDDIYRKQITKNHTATHLLHKALRDVLGEHIHQAGSLVTPERLRFDFSHFTSVDKAVLDDIEQQVNEQVWANLHVEIEQMNINDAKKLGAMALFGEKYGDVVRVVQIGNYSIELCGGCHVQNTSEIGLFKIISESGIGAGVRRIEAATSKQAFQFLQEKGRLLEDAAHALKTKEANILLKIDSLYNELKQYEQKTDKLSAKLASQEIDVLLKQTEKVNGIAVLASEVSINDMNQLRNMLDTLKQKMKSGVILLAAENNGKVLFASGVSNDLTQHKLHAGKLISEAAKICGGGGGGRPDMAQAGGKDPAKISEALKVVKPYVEQNYEN